MKPHEMIKQMGKHLSEFAEAIENECIPSTIEAKADIMALFTQAITMTDDRLLEAYRISLQSGNEVQMEMALSAIIDRE
jgi:hypothetical protein